MFSYIAERLMDREPDSKTSVYKNKTGVKKATTMLNDRGFVMYLFIYSRIFQLHDDGKQCSRRKRGNTIEKLTTIRMLA